MTDNAALVLFVFALIAILLALMARAEPVGESTPPQMTTEDVEATPYVP